MSNVTTELGKEKGQNRNNYGVVINKVTNTLWNNERFQKGLKLQIEKIFSKAGESFGTNSIEWVLEQDDLIDENNARFQDSDILFKRIVLESPTIYIKNFEKIDTTNWVEKTAESKKGLNSSINEILALKEEDFKKTNAEINEVRNATNEVYTHIYNLEKNFLKKQNTWDERRIADKNEGKWQSHKLSKLIATISKQSSVTKIGDSELDIKTRLFGLLDQFSAAPDDLGSGSMLWKTGYYYILWVNKSSKNVQLSIPMLTTGKQLITYREVFFTNELQIL